MTHTRTLLLASICLLAPAGIAAQDADSLTIGNEYSLHEVVVTGTRNETDIRHLPMTISVVGRPATGTTLRALPAARTERAGAGTVCHQPGRDGLRRVRRGGRRLQRARHERKRADAGTDRRASAIHGPVRASHLRRLPDNACRAGGSAARTGIGALRLECHGGRGQHRHPQAEDRRGADGPQRRCRLLRHGTDRGYQPRAAGDVSAA